METRDTGHLFLFSQVVKFRLAMLTEVPKEDRPLQTPELRAQNKPCSSSLPPPALFPTFLLPSPHPGWFLPLDIPSKWNLGVRSSFRNVDHFSQAAFLKVFVSYLRCFCVRLLCFNLHKEKESSFLLEAKQPPVKTNCVGRGLMLSLGGIQQEESKCS